MCIGANCSKPRSCQAVRTDSSNSILVFLKKRQTTDDSGFPPEDGIPHLLGLQWSAASWRRQSPARAPFRLSVSASDHQSLIRKLWKRDNPNEEVAPLMTRDAEVNDSKELFNVTGQDSAEVSILGRGSPGSSVSTQV